MKDKQIITVSTEINAPLELVWNCWTLPEHIVKWNHASDDWHTTRAEVDLRVGGRFSSRMEAKDGSFGFDFGGVYITVKMFELITCILDDDRKLSVSFTARGNSTSVVESFEAEDVHSIEQQSYGWQCILDNFKKHVESEQI